MNAQARPRHLRRLVSAVVVLGLIAAWPIIGAADTAGFLDLTVHGKIGKIVLVDPMGRRSSDDIDGIPRCMRLPGGSETVLDDSVFAAYTSELMEFQMDSLQFGRYELHAFADSQTVVTLTATFEASQPGVAGCMAPTRVDSLAAGCHGWIVDVRRAPPRGECALKISRLVKRKGAVKR